jgi:hypothetical protein
LPRSVLLDVQPSPLLLKRPPDVVSSAAVEAVEFAEEVCGIFLDPWQRWFIDLALSERLDGSWSAFEVGLVCPRQNGKNFILEVVQIACIYLFGDQTLVHSAHKFDTSVEHFNRLRWLFENTPELSDLLLPGDSSFVTSNGKEHIRFNTGQRILFKARYRGGGRGFTGDKVFLDEAYDLPAKAMGSMIPTLSTRKMAQVWYTSSAPHSTSNVLHSVRKRAQSQDDGDRLLYAEWGNEDGVDASDIEAIRRANPAVLAGHITEDYIRQEIRTFSGDPDLVDEHRRERLGIATPLPVDTSSRSVKLPAEQWSACATTDDSTTPCTVAYEVSLDGSWASIVLASGAQQTPYVQQLVHRQGVGWLPDELVRVVRSLQPARVACVGAGPAGAQVGPVMLAMSEAALPVVLEQLSMVAYRQACGAFFSDVVEGRLRWFSGSGPLDAAAHDAAARSYGDAWSWDIRNATVPITPLVAATVARALLPVAAPVQPKKLARMYSF